MACGIRCNGRQRQQPAQAQLGGSAAAHETAAMGGRSGLVQQTCDVGLDLAPKACSASAEGLHGPCSG
eukprot:145174-Prymnesium_polylepis.1